MKIYSAFADEDHEVILSNEDAPRDMAEIEDMDGNSITEEQANAICRGESIIITRSRSGYTPASLMVMGANETDVYRQFLKNLHALNVDSSLS